MNGQNCPVKASYRVRYADSSPTMLISCYGDRGAKSEHFDVGFLDWVWKVLEASGKSGEDCGVIAYYEYLKQNVYELHLQGDPKLIDELYRDWLDYIYQALNVPI